MKIVDGIPSSAHPGSQTPDVTEAELGSGAERLVSGDAVERAALDSGSEVAQALDSKATPHCGASAFGGLSPQFELNSWSGVKSSVEFGPLGRHAYLPYAQAHIEERFGAQADPSAREMRAALWERFAGLGEATEAAGSRDFVGATFDYMKGLNDFARDQLENTPEDGLGIHLRQVSRFATDLLLTEDGRSRFPRVIDAHHAALFADVAAPLHDVLKFLGPKDAQIMADHEVLTSAYVKQHLPGKLVLAGGTTQRVSADDATFVADVIGDHENIEKEEGRRDFINSESEMVRAKALFFVVDVLAGVLVPNGDGRFSIDPAQLKDRFTDLYFRHIDLNGKIFRPQWGAHAIGDLTRTLDVLGQHGLDIQEPPDGRVAAEVLIDAAMQAIDLARIADQQREDPKFADWQHRAIDTAAGLLTEMRHAARRP